MAKAKKKAKKSISLNFKGVEGKRKLLPEDDYKVEVEEVEMKEGDKAPYLAFTFKVVDGKHAGALIWDNASTSEKSLWRLRSLLEALGVEVPDDEMDIEVDDLVGREMIAVVAHEKDADYGTKAKLADFYAVDGDEDSGDDSSEDDDGDEDEDDKKKSKKDKKKSKRDADEDEDGDEDGDDEDGEDDEKARKAKRRKERRAARKGRKSDDDDDSSDDDDGDEDDRKSSKKDKKKDKKKAKKVSADTVQDADEDELESIVEKAGIEVDLDDYKTLKKKQAAVIDALEDAGLLEEDDD